MGTHKNRRTREAFAAINLLVETFPAAFVRINRKPLKLGIAEDMLARGVAPETIKVGLRSYCRGVGYLSAMKAGAARIDLDGNPAGVVTAEDAEYAARKRAEAAEKHQAKIAQDKQRRNRPRPLRRRRPPTKRKPSPSRPLSPPLAQRSPGSPR